jgi:D-arabinose 1-dehydrogenase-like Zn-dependent alcohol dehydrogenase
VAAAGPGVKRLKEGDKVGIAWLHDACGWCDYCITGWETLCERQNNSGYSVNGSFAEYAIGSADYIGHLPERADFGEIAPILCAGVTTYKAIKEADVQPGEWIAIPASVGSATSSCNTPRPWVFTWRRSISASTSWHSPDNLARMLRSMQALTMPWHRS